jgi:FtsP/CotA-like multicopper oxidase with cupredoxin domain
MAKRKEFSRRSALIGGGVAVGAIALAGGGFYAGTLFNENQGSVNGKTGEPEVIRSKNGQLVVDIVATRTLTEIAGQKVETFTYNGSLPGPTWVAKPGDKISVNFTNNLGESTNLHAHGLHISPEGNSDNVMLEIKAGEKFAYEYQLGADHPTGTSWYHPHLHGQAANQLFAGLYGAIIVEDDGAVEANRERVLVISDIDFDDNGRILQPGMMALMMGREGERILVNGQETPEFETEIGALERWRIVNACSSRYLHLHFAGAQIQVLGLDAQPHPKPVDTDELILAPGNRADVLAQLGTKPVEITFDSIVHPDTMTAPTVGRKIATFKPTGATAAMVAGLIAPLTALPSLTEAKLAAKRKFTLAMPDMMSGMGAMHGSGNMGGMNHSSGDMNMDGMFTINGEAFNHLKVNTKVALGSVEEWTIVNTSNMNHPFHLHVWPMQVVSVNGEPVKNPVWQDVVDVRYQSETVVRINFEKFKGKTMYHCHILDHEDQGMMGIIEAV